MKVLSEGEGPCLTHLIQEKKKVNGSIKYKYNILLASCSKVPPTIKRLCSKACLCTQKKMMNTVHHRAKCNICRGMMFAVHAFQQAPLVCLSPPVKTE